MSDLKKLSQRANKLLDRLEKFLPTEQPEPDWQSFHAFRWRRQSSVYSMGGYIQAIHHPHPITLEALHGIDKQKQRIDQNTRQFVQGFSANNVLLTGARGTGKSSLIKALLNRYANDGLRLIEVEKHHLVDLHDIVDKIYQRPERFILFCDDLSFENDEPGYKALKVVLDGSIATVSDNVLIYATSNRRHMVPELMRDNLDTKHIGDEVHPSETVEEKISLSERFGLWLSFYPFDQEHYLQIVAYWLTHYGVAAMTPSVRTEALQWALLRGSRSGRVAWQFARDWAGRQKSSKASRHHS
ncbi:MAG TPA: ATP-binding protein [Nitrosomonas sp.]|nr:ATP-binding protein [Nitrosomonas sp.]HQX13007.1 ATP-binding protein [Nitrosomonas sp.]HRB20231.1 ATP-binding protein [Nitrosomonas sp.]HRB32522.1 ATP-binding protein [Nitrosomonas sp.]HRB46225.1 ATP-binding protein [Nitrosomonas sp.]